MRNSYTEEADHYKIELVQKGISIGAMLIDKEDFELVPKNSWHLSVRGYPAARVDNKLVTIHQLVVNGQSKTIDHISRDKLDNRKVNLRFATQQLNANNVTGRKGYHKNRGKWVTQLRLNGKAVHLGRFNTEQEAKDMYDAAHKYRVDCIEKNIPIDLNKIKKREHDKYASTGFTGQKYIVEYNDKFRVKNKDNRIEKLCDTIEEAIKLRNELYD